MTKALRDAMVKFVDRDELSASQFTQRQQQALDDFARKTGALSRCKRGAGFVFQIRQRQQFDIHLEALAPGFRESLPESLPVRARNIVLTRSSKGAKHGHDYFYPLLKAVGDGPVTWSEAQKDVQLQLHDHTECFGAATMQLHVQDGWQSNRPLWLVENQEVFDYADWLLTNEPVTLLYYPGQLHNNLIEWLAHKRRVSRVILFPDYDGVGLSNYVRLRARLGDHCCFWLMPNWQEKLARYGNNKVWQSTRNDFEQACLQLEGELHELTSCMREQALALEQEVVRW